jgi:arylamine N-acetyltransferase
MQGKKESVRWQFTVPPGYRRHAAADPGETLARIAAGGNAGYCFHHNGAFEVVLRALGFAVERRSGQVWGREHPPLNHLALLVTIAGRRWWPDVGLGDAFRDPVEVGTGEIRQGPFRYEITDAGAWSFRHDPAVDSIAGLDVRARCPSDPEVAAAHRVLSTPPDGRFTRTLVILKRDGTGIERLRGIRYQRTGDGAFRRDLRSYDDWRAALEPLGISLTRAADDELRSLHTRMLAAQAKLQRVTTRNVAGEYRLRTRRSGLTRGAGPVAREIWCALGRKR